MVKRDERRKRQARLPSLRPVLIAAAVLGLAAVQSPTAPAREGRIAGEARRTAVTLREGGDPRVRLAPGEDLGVALGQRAESLLADSGTPLSLASADFDGDGVPDLAAGYRLDNAGALVLWRGNVDSIHPNTPDAMRRREKGEFLESPFFPSRLALETDEPPDWLFAGDFDGDGIADIVYAARGSSALHILPGNGAGGFRAPSRRDLPGAITAIAGGSLDPAGGTLGIAVAILSGRGASLLFLDRGSSGTLDAVPLPSPAAALAIVRPEGDAQSEVAAACGTDLLLVHRGINAPPGAGSVERRPLPFFAAALEAGNFGTGSRQGLAMMAGDGRSWLLLPGEVPAPEKLVGAPRVLAAAGQKQVRASPVPYLPSGGLAAIPASTTRAAALRDWALVEMSGSSPDQGVGIRAARVSGSEADDLLVLDGHGQRIEVVSASEPQDAGSGGSARALSARTFSPSFSSSALEVAGAPAAVLPMRLNSDAISDLVVLRAGSIAPAVVLSASALSLTVNSNGDTGDASPGNGICADSNGNCTLRAAIQEANASAGADTISFNISGAGVHTITTGTQLPTITGTVTIDGTTQPGYAGSPLIELKGAAGQLGLTIQVSDCVVRGLAVNGYLNSGQQGGVGIYITSVGPLVKNALIEGNFIGTDPAGTTAKPNHIGIDIENTSLNLIGGTTAAARNLVSGNDYVGIQVVGPGATGDNIQGNSIGTVANGSAALGNALAGINIFADGTVVGGAAAGAGNVISGNPNGGVFTTQFCAPGCFGSSTTVKANKVGTNPAGTAAVPNGVGIQISSPGSPNSTIANNLVSGNVGGGIATSETLTTVTNITGNLVGTDISGTKALGNGTNGGILVIAGNSNVQVNVGGATGTTPLGSCTGSCNLVSANSPFGVYASGPGPVTIAYNSIGTDVTGTLALGNDPGGVVLNTSGKTLGSSIASGNLISGNGNMLSGGFGVLSLSSASPGNTIKGNFIGTTASGNTALPNLGDGVTLGASDTLGSISDPNTISGNAGNGVVVPSSASFARVQGNRIGVKVNGAALGNGFDGVNAAASDLTISNNAIANNSGNGVTITGTAVRDSIRGNVIHHNASLGIDLGGDGVTANDAGDGDTGPNDLMNFPDGIVASWDSAANKTTISGHLDTSSPNTAVVDLYSNSIKDPSSHGQGEAYLGSATPDSNGQFCLTITGLPAFTPGTPADGVLQQPPWLSATATNAAGSTSEFADTSLPAVTLVALEVTQSAQDWKNSLPLIQNKVTYVRAHLQTTDPSSMGIPVKLRLRGFQGGVELAGSPVTVTNFGDLVVRPASQTFRDRLAHSANFRVPDAWTVGTTKFSVERTDGPMACSEVPEANNPGSCGDCAVQVAFEDGKTVRLKFPLISWKSPDGKKHVWDDAHRDDLFQQVNAMYPIASLPDVKRGSFDYAGEPPGLIAYNNNQNLGPEPTIEGPINKDLQTMRELDFCFTNIGCKRMYYGILRDIPAGGMADDIPGNVASGNLPDQRDFRRGRHCHELGHVLGHDHASDPVLFGTSPGSKPGETYSIGPCGEFGNNPPKPAVFPNFFTIGGNYASTLGPILSGPNALVFGFDTSAGAPRVYDPNQHFEIMGYCFQDPTPPRWISDFTYKNMHTEIVARFPSSESVSVKKSESAQDYMLVRGDIDLATDSARIDPLLRIPSSGTPDVPAAGEYTLQMRNVSDGVVAQVSFKPTRDVPESPTPDVSLGRFVIPIPFDASIRKAVLLHNGVVLATRNASAHAPTVTVASPNGGENVTADPVSISWTASDADGDPLLSTVQFSADNGATWDTLALNWPNQSIPVPHSSLAKTTQGLIRVIVTDGFNTAVDSSNAVFSVSNNAPSVSILQPTAGQLFAGNQQIVFQAFAHDVEDGLLTGASLQWSSNVNGSLGSGSALLKQADQLPAGAHTITVTATDSGSLIAQASVNITILAAAPATWADLSVSAASSPETPVSGSPMILTLTVHNSGKDTATAVTVADTLPAGSAFNSAGATQGSCGQSGGVVTCGLGSLASDASATVTITITPSGPGDKTNSAAVSAAETDPVPADNSTSFGFVLEPPLPGVSAPASQGVCLGGTAVFSAAASGTGPFAYRWYKDGFDLSDGGGISGSATATLTINPVSAASAGKYILRVTDGFGQHAISANAILTVNPPPSAAIAGPASVCALRAGNHASVPSAGPGATYAWTIGNGTITSGAGTNTIVFLSGSSGTVTLNVTVTGSCGSPAAAGVVIPIGACSAQPQNLAVDPTVDFSNGNGILEPGEQAIVKPFWKNPGGAPLPLTGAAVSLTGPAGAVYSLKDAAANYGTIAPGATNDCATATGNCYEIGVSDPGVRPAAHWDLTLTETLSDGDPAWVWPIHVGRSFTDVPTSHVFYQFVERIFHNGVTTGCTATSYCPDLNVFRLQMAVFIARSQAGGDGNIPVSGSAQGNPYNCVAGGQSQFTDIAPDNPFCRHVHYLFSTGVTTGCVTTPPRQYCPSDNVSRGQMALFIARAVAGSDAAVPVTYGPDPVTGRSYSCNAGTPNLHFTDIATSDIFCRHVHYLWAKDVISGFPDGSFGPSLLVTRGAMAKFLANGFGESLIK